MSIPRWFAVVLLMVSLLIMGAAPSGAEVIIQCPGDLDGDAIPDPASPDYDPNVQCMHISAGDGFATMADGKGMYVFSFSDVTGVPVEASVMAGMLAANIPAPLIMVNQGEEFYLTLTNVGMMVRPDLFDPHTVHWHGFPNASAVFDGVPDASISINMMSSLTYYYKVPAEPGTYMWHCHVEATEHMQMGMLGNLYVRPAQDGELIGGYTQFAYNDVDGSTGYDVDYPIQLTDMDPDFHDASFYVQPLPFALMKDKYHLINGRGYPDTIDPGVIGGTSPDGEVIPQAAASQPMPSLIEAEVGNAILLRISNLSVTEFHTLTALGIPMRVVGKDARQLKGSTGLDLSYYTTSVTLGGGEAVDVILETDGLEAGTYFLFSRNLSDLNNNEMDRGGMMTEIHLTAAPL